MSTTKDPKKPKKAQGRAADELPCEVAYRLGNYTRARSLAKAALEGDQAERARAVLERVAVDKVPLLVFAGCVLFYAAVAFFGLH